MKREKLTLGWRGKTAREPDIRFVDVTEEVPLPTARAQHQMTIAEKIEASPLDICLGYWVTWMHRDDRDLGAKSQGCIKGGGDESGEGYDTNAAADAAETRMICEIGEATDAMIDSLDRHYKECIYRRCSIVATHAVWKFPNLDIFVTLPLAEQALVEKLKKNLATRALF
jgi:hypothetical protein